MKGTLRFPVSDPEAAVADYLSRLTNALYELVPKDLEVRGTQIKVRGGLFRWASSFNLLTALTSVTVTAAASPPDLSVTYDISFLETFVLCVAFTVWGIPALIYQRVPWFLLAMYPLMVWGYLYWVYRRITRYRLKGLLQRIAEEMARAQPG
jgi:hypothetical protein